MYTNLQLRSDFVTQHLEKAEDVVVATEGGIDIDQYVPDVREMAMRRSANECARVFDGKKTINVFKRSRVDPRKPIEETLAVLKALKEGGKI